MWTCLNVKTSLQWDNCNLTFASAITGLPADGRLAHQFDEGREVSDLLQRLNLRRVIDLAGTETINGAAPVPSDVIADVVAILPERVEMLQLQRAACETISRVCGAEAGYVTGCAAAGIAISVAACMTGCDMALVERLPGASGLRSNVILQKGQNTNFGAAVSQMIRLAGADVLEIGTATDCALFQLRAALGPDVGAAVYVVSHHAVVSGLIPLSAFCATCHYAGVPVIVDAAAEVDWKGYLSAGADIVVVSAHKNLSGPTAGIVMGSLDLVRACAFQDRGIGRPMKAGKEAIVGVIAALERWERLDHTAFAREHAKVANLALERLRRVRGLTVDLEPDPTGQNFHRVRIAVDPSVAGIDAYGLTQALAAGSPKIVFRSLHVDRGYVRGDFRQVNEEVAIHVCDRINEIIESCHGPAPCSSPPQRGDQTVAALENWPHKAGA